MDRVISIHYHPPPPPKKTPQKTHLVYGVLLQNLYLSCLLHGLNKSNIFTKYLLRLAPKTTRHEDKTSRIFAPRRCLSHTMYIPGLDRPMVHHPVPTSGQTVVPALGSFSWCFSTRRYSLGCARPSWRTIQSSGTDQSQQSIESPEKIYTTLRQVNWCISSYFSTEVVKDSQCLLVCKLFTYCPISSIFTGSTHLYQSWTGRCL